MKFTNCQNVDCNKEYDFNDLIDVAVQAKKDNIIGDLKLGNKILYFKNNEENFSFGSHNVKDGINFINFLYTETFVIESEEDLKRIKVGSKITLLNEQVITVRAVGNYGVYFEEDNSNVGALILKGATVIQKRSL